MKPLQQFQNVLVLALAAASAAALHAAESLPPLFVSASRSPQPPAATPVRVEWISGAELAAAGSADLALRDDPAFALFRRNSSLTAHPTAQGVSLRGIGPSGASRTLVLLDGLPLNDPFGGWVNWSAVPGLSLGGAEIVHGGGSGVWGNSALGGIVAFESTPLSRFSGNTTSPDNRAAFELGELGFRRGEVLATTGTSSAGWGALQLEARAQRYRGFFAVPAERRGAVDRPVGSDHEFAQLRWSRALTSRLQLDATVRHFDERRENGTALQENDTRSTHAALRLRGELAADQSWSVAGWAQWQRFASFFTAVAADRNTETPTNDQFAVPATAAGASASWQRQTNSASTVVGADVRRVEGETRENFLLRNGAFAQQRRTGGTQWTGGVFANHEQRLAAKWRASAAARLDRWENRAGRNRETSLETGATLRDEFFAARRGTEFSPRLGANWQPASNTTVRGAVYRAFRLPTLNEYYRPFRVGTVNTLANPALGLERLSGADLGIERATGAVRWSANGFANWIDGAVTSVTLSSTPTATTRQRQNLDAIRVRGVELSGVWSPVRVLELRVGWLRTDAEIREAIAQPNLVGRRPAAVPRDTVTAALTWTMTPPTRLSVRGRWSSRQFEDDENQLALAAGGTIDARLEHTFSPVARAFVALENLSDHRIETSRSAAGLVTYDQPRAARGGVEFSW